MQDGPRSLKTHEEIQEFEISAVRYMLDVEHLSFYQQRKGDSNIYILGELMDHNVVLACLPVGIGGGVPSSSKHDIRLGDVVVSMPEGAVRRRPSFNMT
ncbi:hypothetical protein AJ78_08504 [Emergomyces pasteurianus Ep9510]|uniref:Uncharacterized protein n=1 Tax=Emergomyces pasteurianus Ep9510 TaxID=1447872 RepID=A0A1J9P2B2_9EURO|nr:hypothetical protein AJ78_08504 [Emergomyces pasteurianus Ep9510]